MFTAWGSMTCTCLQTLMKNFYISRNNWRSGESQCRMESKISSMSPCHSRKEIKTKPKEHISQNKKQKKRKRHCNTKHDFLTLWSIIVIYVHSIMVEAVRQNETWQVSQTANVILLQNRFMSDELKNSCYSKSSEANTVVIYFILLEAILFT